MSLGENPPTRPNLPRALSAEFLVVGVLWIILGLLALMAPLLGGVVAVVFIGVAILLAGVGALVHAFRARNWEGALFDVIAGILAILCGILVLGHPIAGLGFLTILIAVWFILDGVTRIVLAFQMSTVRGSGWGWTLFSGIVSILLGVLIWAQWPSSAVWAVGTLVGINLLITGWAWVALGLEARRA
jgi:uncharacterized membrane protein HdeD (DUF308 family)